MQCLGYKDKHVSDKTDKIGEKLLRERSESSWREGRHFVSVAARMAANQPGVT